MLDLSYVWNLHDGDKIELCSEFAHNMFKVASIFSLVSVEQRDILALSNPSKGKGYLEKECRIYGCEVLYSLKGTCCTIGGC